MVALVIGLGAPGEARASEPAAKRFADRWEHLDPRAKNQVAIEGVTLGNFGGVDFAYRRGLGRHFSAGALFEYAYPNPGYGHLVGFGHTVEFTGWIKRPWNGLFFSLTFTVGHQFVYGLPELATVALGGGATVGWSWDLTRRLNVALGGGLRRMGVVERSAKICTLPDQCIFTAEGFRPRFALTFAYRF